ncbi:outer membrane lipid asymmetry maintenance protein MlaD [Roseobacter sp. HKCCA0882]|jgi:phospholipid/cholesterol/gamma-HCH transport system substrate-binding protein|uniref:outer membrane lipid asymmetry maintenance protein MlaD n=1 Tax=Roseobacter sp. HKCCA0882 TaxID=3120337 RepID=UPI0030EF3291
MAENRLSEILVGGAVLAVAAGFLLYAAEIGGIGRSTGSSYEVSALFRSAEGIGIGTDVRLAGVRVGTVSSLNLDLATFRAEATLNIRDDILLPDDSIVSIASEGLLGGSFVDIQPGGSPFNLTAGDEVLNTQSSVSLVTLLMRAFSGSGQ